MHATRHVVQNLLISFLLDAGDVVVATVGVEETADPSIEASADQDYGEEFQVASHDFSPLTLFIGPVPVVLTPRLEVYPTASGSSSAELGFDAEQDRDARPIRPSLPGPDGRRDVGERSRVALQKRAAEQVGVPTFRLVGAPGSLVDEPRPDGVMQ